MSELDLSGNNLWLNLIIKFFSREQPNIGNVTIKMTFSMLT